MLNLYLVYQQGTFGLSQLCVLEERERPGICPFSPHNFFLLHFSALQTVVCVVLLYMVCKCYNVSTVTIQTEGSVFCSGQRIKMLGKC